MADAIAQLRGFARLEPDWNSYGAKPVSRDAISVATDLLTHIARIAQARPDFVAPLANGGVQLEWSGAAAEIAVRVSPDQTLAYLSTEGGAHTEEHDVPLDEVVRLVVQTLSR
ncbi:MAG: hypothetical protein ACR2JW_04835 [Thermomicrobiales bacterium]